MSIEPALAPLYATAAIRALEARRAGEPLMERAGEAAEPIARALAGERGGAIVVLAGPGNNGGDGFVLARRLREAFHDVVVVFIGDAAALPPDAARAHAALLAAGGTTTGALPTRSPALIVDALFGLGLSRPLAEPYASLVRWANAQPAPTLALDIPSGLQSDTGIATGPVVVADATATFIALKPGLVTGDGPDVCGAISVHTLGIDAAREVAPSGRLVEWPALAVSLPEPLRRRVRAVHKGTFGTVAVLGGARGMVGAALLAGRAAARCGAGKVRVGFVGDDAPPVDMNALELMLSRADAALAAGADAFVVGCGFGTADGARHMLEQAIAVPQPLVLDADALNLVSTDAQLRSAVRARAGLTVVTPHPAEAARLLGGSVDAVQHDRIAAACTIAADLDAHVVLKGVGTIVAHPDGGFDVNASGNPALAFGGSGDVLAGMLGACLAQHADGVASTRVAVCLHGAAADALVERGIGPIGVSATELVDAARELLNLPIATAARPTRAPRSRS